MGIADDMAALREPKGHRGQCPRFLDEFQMAHTAVDELPEVEVRGRAGYAGHPRARAVCVVKRSDKRSRCSTGGEQAKRWRRPRRGTRTS